MALHPLAIGYGPGDFDLPAEPDLPEDPWLPVPATQLKPFADALVPLVEELRELTGRNHAVNIFTGKTGPARKRGRRMNELAADLLTRALELQRFLRDLEDGPRFEVTAAGLAAMERTPCG